MTPGSRWTYAAVFAYVAGFLLFPPRVLLIIDEFNYVAQAVAFAHGALTIPGADPIFPANPLAVASNYPPGTSLLQSPLVALAGWRAAAFLSVLSLVLATVLTMRWLKELGHHPAFAVLLVAYPGTLFFGRVAMSDVPSLAVVSLSLWLLWRAERGAGSSVAAGFTAAVTILFRETNALIVAPFVVGALARRRGVPWALIAGGAMGIALRLWTSWALFGSPIYLRDPGYGFSLGSAVANLPQYALVLLVFFPLGALLPSFYRGPRRVEVLSAFWLYTAMLLFYTYDSVAENGFVRGLLLASRFVVPLLPILVLTAADVYPRWLAAMPVSWRRASARFRPILYAIIVVIAFVIHPAMRREERAPLAIVTAIQRHTTAEVPVITNHHATLKYLSPVYGIRRLILRSYLAPDDVPRFQREHGRLSIVFLDRRDSDLFREDAAQNDLFLMHVKRFCRVDSVAAGDAASPHLRMFTVNGCT